MRPPFANGEDNPGFRGGPRRGHRGGGPGGPKFDRGPGRPANEVPDAGDAAGWFSGRLPEGWFVGAPSVVVDREEITIIGELPALTEAQLDAAATAAAEVGRIARFREDTREARIDIARQAEHRYRRHITWGARLGDSGQVFTQLAAPVMTRLLQSERQVLDTLIDAGVARSRSEALVWAVRLVGQNEQEWLGQLREAMEQVSKLRNAGPGFAGGPAGSADPSGPADSAAEPTAE